MTRIQQQQQLSNAQLHERSGATRLPRTAPGRASVADTFATLPTPNNPLAQNNSRLSRSREEKRKDTLRRLYALVELLETERGYVHDLKLFVEVRVSLFLSLLLFLALCSVSFRPAFDILTSRFIS